MKINYKITTVILGVVLLLILAAFLYSGIVKMKNMSDSNKKLLQNFIVLISDKSQKDLDSYTVGYKTDDGKGTRTEITKRIGDFYCKVQEFYDTKTKEVDMGNYFCAKIGGSIIMSASDTIDCALVLNTGTPKELDTNLDICFK